MEEAFCMCRVHGIVHTASEEGQAARRLDGETYPADVVRDVSAYDSTDARRPVDLLQIADEVQLAYYLFMSAQTLGFAIQPEDRPVLDELVAYFGDGNRSAYLRATLKVMKSIMIADQLREAQAYGQQRTAELGIDPSDIPARVQEFLKADS
jgi:hypothetical protein